MIDLTRLEQILESMSAHIEKETCITLCGGASMVINYQSRESTRDVDCVYVDKSVKSLAVTLAEEYGLDIDWLNDNVCVTQSYSAELLQHKTFYKTFGKMKVYTITGLPLLCMKLVSWRPNSSDYEDCIRIIEALRKDYTISDVYNMMKTIYGTNALLSVDAERCLKYEFGTEEYTLDEESVDSYVYSLDAGDISMRDIPVQFRPQIGRRYNQLRAKSKCDQVYVALG